MAIGDRSVEVTLADWKELVQRSYRGLKPKIHFDSRSGEFVVDLHFSENVGARVYTSIHRGEVSAGIGKDAMRVLLFYPKLGRPAKKGTATSMKRTINWRDTFKKHMHALEDEYEDKETYWESRAQGLSLSTQPQPEPPKFEPQDEPDVGINNESAPVVQQPVVPQVQRPVDPPTEAQLKYVKYLLSRTSWPTILNHPKAKYLPRNLKELFDPSLQEVLSLLDKRSVSTVIDIAKETGGGYRSAGDLQVYGSDDDSYEYPGVSYPDWED